LFFCEKLKLSTALDVAIEVASALAAAHEAGIVHRDIKPENAMVRRDGYVIVLNFAVANLIELRAPAADSAPPTMVRVKTDPGTVMGAARYMSPEQTRGLEVDAQRHLQPRRRPLRDGGREGAVRGRDCSGRAGRGSGAVAGAALAPRAGRARPAATDGASVINCC
jgi:serine/threonine protein kinase